MGLFDFLKKKEPVKKPSVTLSFSIGTAPGEHELWPKKNGNSDNDFVNALFLNLHKDKAHTPDAFSYLGYLSYKYGIKNTAVKHKDMLKQGYFRLATPEEVLKSYRMDDLKGILKSHDLKTSGKKVELISRILEEVPIKSIQLPQLYSVSDKGLEFIKEHEDLLSLHDNKYEIRYDEYIAQKNNLPSFMKYNDIVWAVLNARKFGTSQEDMILRERNFGYCADFLSREERYHDALCLYIAAMYYKVNNVIKDYLSVEKDNRSIKYGELMPLPELRLPESVAETLYSLRDYYKEELVPESIERVDLKVKYISDSAFQSFANNFFETRDTDFSKYLKYLK